MPLQRLIIPNFGAQSARAGSHHGHGLLTRVGSAAPPSGDAAFQAVLATFNGRSAATYTVPITTSSSGQPGSRIVVAVTSGAGTTLSSVADTKSNSYPTHDSTSAAASPGNNTGLTSAKAAAQLVGGTDSVTVTLTGSAGCTVAVLEYIDVASSGYLDAAGSASGAGTSVNPSLTTTGTNEMVVAAAGTASTTAAMTAPSGFTQRVALVETNLSLTVADTFVAAAGTVAVSFTATGSTTLSAASASYRTGT